MRADGSELVDLISICTGSIRSTFGDLLEDSQSALEDRRRNLRCCLKAPDVVIGLEDQVGFSFVRLSLLLVQFKWVPHFFREIAEANDSVKA